MVLDETPEGDIYWWTISIIILALHHSWIYEAEANIRSGMSIYTVIIAQYVPRFHPDCYSLITNY
jgi:hypothetical protein